MRGLTIVSIVPMIMIMIVAQVASQTAGAAPPKSHETQHETQLELHHFQGLWQTWPGGMQHRGGRQVVANPIVNGPCFFVHGKRLLWLDEEGRPTGKEETITLNVKARPKRITLTPVGKARHDRPKHGIYTATKSTLTVHLGLGSGPAPKQFLKMNKPIKGLEGREWLISRKKIMKK